MEEKLLGKLCNTFSSLTVAEVKCTLVKISNKHRSVWEKYSPLVSAVEAKRKDLIQLMVKDLGFDIDSICKQTFYFSGAYLYSALSKAIENGDEDMIRFLIDEMKATVNINYCREKLQSPLIYAIRLRKFQIVKLLVEQLGADVNFRASRTEDGSNTFTALHASILNNRNWWYAFFN